MSRSTATRRRNDRCGIPVAHSQDARIVGNLAEGNLRVGISAEADQAGCRRLEVRENLGRNNGGHGIEIIDARDATVEGNTTRDNGADRPTAAGASGRSSAAARSCPEVGDSATDLGGRIFLEEVAPLDRDFSLVGPGTAELALGTDEDHAGLGVDEELRHLRGAEPAGVAGHEGRHVGGLAVEGDLPRPGQHGRRDSPGSR